MAHNFRILDGDYYVSKSGHDSNDGLTPDTPKKLFTNGYGKIVYGAGNYQVGLVTGNYFGDGKLIISESTFPGGSLYRSTEDMTFSGCHFTNVSGNGRGWVFRDCIFKNCTGELGYAVGTVNLVPFQIFSNNIIINSRETPNGNGSSIQSKRTDTTILINSSYGLASIANSYVDRNSILYMRSNSTTSLIQTCNIQGLVFYSGLDFTDTIGKYYAIQDLFVGTPQDNGYVANVKWLNEANLTADGFIPVIVGRDSFINACINQEPLFNNPSIDDYTLQAGSPHIGRAGDGGNIGGTQIGISILNSGNGTGNLEVIPSPEINITDPNTYTLKVGEVEGYIDYIQKLGSSSLTLGVISPISTFNFDSDFPGGDIENRNVPDSEPLTYDYPREFITSSDANDLRTLVIAGHNAQINEWVRVNGEDREVISTTSSTITVGTNFRALIIAGTMVMVGSKSKIGALRPNRLTYLLRTSKQDARPTLLSHWDNDIDPLYNKTGQYLAQEWDITPGYFIDPTLNSVYGSGDSDAPQGLTLNEIACKWINVRVYIRNNYKS